MPKVASPLRRPSLKELFEDLGFIMTAVPDATRHKVLRPTGLKLVDHFEHEVGRPGRGRRKVIREGMSLVWGSYTIEEADPALTRPCLWQFAASSKASPEAVQVFVEEWGIYDNPGLLGDPGYWSLEEFHRQAKVIRDVLIMLVSTEGDEDVTDDVFWTVARFSLLEDDLDLFTENIERPNGPGDEDNDRLRTRWKHWRELRSSGRGVELQARMIADLICTETQFNEPEKPYVWDAQGRRRADLVATGVHAIVWSHIAALFMSSSLDTYVCAACGNPYPFNAEVSKRRPRSGMQNFCSPECRAEGRRAANRASWQKHGADWRPRGSRTRRRENSGEAK